MVLFTVAVLLGGAVAVVPGGASSAGTGSGAIPTVTGTIPFVTGAATVTAMFFYDQNCHDCQQALPFVQALESRYPGVTFEYHDLSLDPADRELLFALAETHNLSYIGVPTLVVGSEFCRDWDEIERRGDSVILAAVGSEDSPRTGASTPLPAAGPGLLTAPAVLGIMVALASRRRR